MFVDEDTFVNEDAEQRLEDELAAQAARVDAELCRLLELVAESERGLRIAGDTTFAGWFAWRCSLLPRQAREYVRLAERLGELPLIHARFAAGELSLAKVRALALVADAASEAELVELAEVMTASQLQRAVAAYRRVTTEEAAEQQEREILHWFWTEDGSLCLRGLLPAEDGALLVRALDAARDALRERRSSAPAEEAVAVEVPIGAVEALVAVADLALSRVEADRAGGDRYQVVVHVEAGTLTGDGEGRCELADGVALAPETARRLACDASVVELREQDGRTLSLGRKRRTLSAALRRALAARDQGCCFPGCTRRRFVDAHHIEHWGTGGETNLDNLVLLCRRHHRLVHVPSVPRPPPLPPPCGDRMHLNDTIAAFDSIKRRHATPTAAPAAVT
jgi:hypothetical protein